MGLRALHLLFFASGTAGLVYQVVWVREFGNLFGNTIHSAAVVTSLFMLGLGVGGLLAGLVADRLYRRSPLSVLRAYGFVELAIAVAGQAVASLLPVLGPLAASWSAYETGSDGWLRPGLGGQLATYGVAIALLLPVTCLMGATLTLLIRYAVRSDLSLSGRRVGSLYGVNTAGAAAGAFLVDFTLVPVLGLAATVSVAVVLNLAVGLVVLVVARPAGSGAPSPPEPSAPPPVAPPAGRRSLVAAEVAIVLSGFAGMGLEILWFRQLVSALGGHRTTFSLLLAVILVGIWAGALLGGAASRRVRSPALLWAAVQAALAVVVLASMARFAVREVDPAAFVAAWQAAPGPLRPLVEIWSRLSVIVGLVGPASILLGAAYPLANAHAQRVEARVGTRAGLLYLGNTVGAVAGALATGFLLLPGLGTQGSVAALAATSAASGVLLLAAELRAPARSTVRLAAAGALAASAGCLLLWLRMPAGHLARTSFRPVSPAERLLAVREGPSETIWVSEDPGGGRRRLYTNGHSMSATGYPAQRYMRAFAHLPLLMTEAPRSVLVIGFGVGSTTHAASLHPSVERIDVVDISADILRHAPLFEASNRGVLEDPRVRVHVNDGRQHLRMTEAAYDLVTLEPPPLAHAGVGALYSTEFYRLARARLTAGGLLTQWLPAHQVPPPVTASLVHAFVEVFPRAVVVSGYGTELILVGRRDGPTRIDLDAVLARLADRSAVRTDLRSVDLAHPVELVGTFVGGPEALARTSGHGPPLTDDWPIMEYDTQPFPGVMSAPVPRDLFDPGGVVGFCPTCFTPTGPRPEVDGLPAYLTSATAFALAPGVAPPTLGSSYLEHLYGSPP